MTDAANLPAATGSAAWRLPFGRRGFVISALALIGAGLALNWGWLSAVGAAPLILALAPCAAMCASGLCMKGGSKSCSSKTDAAAEPGQSPD